MRAICRLTAVLAALAASVGCGSSSSPTTPSTPATTTTETFTGTISEGNAHAYSFTSNPGTVTVVLNSVQPDSSIAIGMSLGTWDGGTCTVGSGLFNDNAVVNATITATVTTTGALCARIYDGPATITQPTTYVITVVHP